MRWKCENKKNGPISKEVSRLPELSLSEVGRPVDAQFCNAKVHSLVFGAGHTILPQRTQNAACGDANCLRLAWIKQENYHPK